MNFYETIKAFTGVRGFVARLGHETPQVSFSPPRFWGGAGGGVDFKKTLPSPVPFLPNREEGVLILMPFFDGKPSKNGIKKFSPPRASRCRRAVGRGQGVGDFSLGYELP